VITDAGALRSARMVLMVFVGYFIPRHDYMLVSFSC
jgi:hypothetical protein